MKKTDWIQTYSGIAFFPMEPDPELILLPDIAHALSNQCRFSGHVRKFYSVAQHCVEVANLLKVQPPHIQLAGLLHDASEAYLVDLPKPLKRKMPDYVTVEKGMMEAISKRFGLSFVTFDSPPVHDADRASFVIESQLLMEPLHPDFYLDPKDLENASGLTIEKLWAPEEAEKEYLKAFSRIWKKRMEQVHQ